MNTGKACDVREELANVLTHGLGLVLSAIAFPVLLWLAIHRGNFWHILSCSIYGATLVLLYASSTLYHSCRTPGLKQWLRLFDHGAVFLLIAGTYTPFTLVTLRGPWGWSLFAVVWSLSLLGIVIKAAGLERLRMLPPVLYVGIGWLAVLAIKPLLILLTWKGLAWLLAGGLAYTCGLIFFVWDRIPYNHAIWHVFVLAGSACHYVAVVGTILLPKK